MRHGVFLIQWLTEEVCCNFCFIKNKTMYWIQKILGEQNGYNIPEMISVPDMPQWLSEEGARTVNETSSNDKLLPEHAKRLFCDAYMCMYQSTDVMMYR